MLPTQGWGQNRCQLHQQVGNGNAAGHGCSVDNGVCLIQSAFSRTCQPCLQKRSIALNWASIQMNSSLVWEVFSLNFWPYFGVAENGLEKQSGNSRIFGRNMSPTHFTGPRLQACLLHLQLLGFMYFSWYPLAFHANSWTAQLSPQPLKLPP